MMQLFILFFIHSLVVLSAEMMTSSSERYPKSIGTNGGQSRDEEPTGLDESQMSRGNDVTRMSLCNDKYGSVDVTSFHQRSCAFCYSNIARPGGRLVYRPGDTYLLYLTPQSSPLSSSTSSSTSVLFSSPSFLPFQQPPSESPAGGVMTQYSVTPVTVDPGNETSMAVVCDELSATECTSWRYCCFAAVRCCDRQNKTRTRHDGLEHGDRLRGERVRDGGGGDEVLVCSSTWDGYSCWDAAKAGSHVQQLCPAYIKSFISSEHSSKHCQGNGTWLTNGGYSWTNYTPCLGKEIYMRRVYISVTFNSISVVMLVPAIALFCLFRDLFKQDRIRLHVHFFVSLTLVCLVNITWYLTVQYQLLANLDNTNNNSSPIRTNPVWCRVLSFFKIYLTSTNYFWMFCEGYHLHRLIANAFEASSSAIGIYMTGWVVPAVCTLAYACVRAFIANDSCWTLSIGAYQWIIYIPNLLCLIMNLIFLSNILRTLMFQLHAHPHEPSNFRRGLKAGFMLVPLFGVQLLLTIYRPDVGDIGEIQYEYVTLIVTNSQGIFVSLIFCFFNGEVLAQIRRHFPRLLGRQDTWRHGGVSHVTHVTTAADTRGGDEYTCTRYTAVHNGTQDIKLDSDRKTITVGGRVKDVEEGATNQCLIRSIDDDDEEEEEETGSGGEEPLNCHDAIPLKQLTRKLSQSSATQVVEEGKDEVRHDGVEARQEGGSDGERADDGNNVNERQMNTFRHLGYEPIATTCILLMD